MELELRKPYSLVFKTNGNYYVWNPNFALKHNYFPIHLGDYILACSSQKKAGFRNSYIMLGRDSAKF